MDTYELFLEKISYLSVLKDSEKVFAKRRARQLGIRLFRYLEKIQKVRNTDLKNDLLDIHYSNYTLQK